MNRQQRLQQVIDNFGKRVIQQSRSNLSKGKKNTTSSLYRSLAFKGGVKGERFSGQFYMEDYGMFVDQGVKGKESTAKAPQSPFRFGTGTGRKGGLSESIPKWVQAKRFQFRDKKGKFLSYEQTGFIIARSIYRKGIKPSYFFTKPFGLAFSKLPYEIAQAMKPNKEDLQ
jgi:hypothetical protein